MIKTGQILTIVSTQGEQKQDGTIGLLNDRSFKTAADLDRVIWPDETDMEERLQYVREYVAAARGTNGVLANLECSLDIAH